MGSNVIRNFKVQWSKTLTATKEYTLNTIAYDSLSVWGKVFETTLNQVIDLQYGLLTGSSAASVEIPVTYRDFHEDRTCPEFEAPHTASQYAPSCGNRGCPGTGCSGSNPCNGCDPNYWYRSKWKNMLARNLDSYHKPQLGKYCHSNAYVKYWFRNWDGSDGSGLCAKGDSTMPVYSHTHINNGAWYKCPWDASGKNCYSAWHRCDWDSLNHITVPGDSISNGIGNELTENDSTYTTPNVHFDTSFKNYVIQDSLQFTLLNAATGTYQFKKSGFWPLDGGRGFANDSNWSVDCACNDSVYGSPTYYYNRPKCKKSYWPRHNYSWTMEMQTSFTMAPNMHFSFAGDDDLWLFLDDTLLIDLGGPTNGGGDSVCLDTIPRFKNYQKYRFSLFYCERHSNQQNCCITTNMLVFKTVQNQQRSWSRNYGTLQ